MRHYFNLVVTLALLALLVFIPIACTKSAVATKLGNNDVIKIQQMPFMNARFYAVMNFNFNGQDVTFPTELEIPSVPLEWMGTIFNGLVKEAGPGEDVTDEVHGSVSADGNWIESVYYSRQIIRKPNNTGVFYRVTLRNIPLIASGTIGKDAIARFYQEGDVHKFVDKIEYIDGYLNNGKIVPGTSLISIDWTNTGRGSKPILQVRFETISNNSEQGPTTPGSMGGGGMK